MTKKKHGIGEFIMVIILLAIAAVLTYIQGNLNIPMIVIMTIATVASILMIIFFDWLAYKHDTKRKNDLSE